MNRACCKDDSASEELPSVASREELIYLLAEAAELEHGLMCSYLFAAFSLKRGAADLTANEQRAVDEWRASILSVAMEEMLHLALVQNLLAAVGGAPHLQRPNFPVAPGFYPSGVVLELTGFNADTLAHFVFLERPEGAKLPDGNRFAEAAEYTRPKRQSSVTPSAQDYPTIGALYRGIEVGFERLAAELGEVGLLVGQADAQVGPSLLSLDGLHPVTDLASVRRAIERIIEQGEGGRDTHEDSHFERFQRMQRELEALRRARVEFEPAHRVVANPVMNAPAEPERCTHIDAHDAARVLDVATATYGLMVQLLMCFFCGSGEGSDRRKLIDGAVTVMTKALGPLAELLARLPASPAAPGRTAGLSFTLPRSIHALPRNPPCFILLHERASQLAAACAALAPEVDMSLASVGTHLARLAQSFKKSASDVGR